MDILIDVLLGIAGLAVVILWALSDGLGDILFGILDDLRNRNDRGKGKLPSEKYVTR